MFTRLNERMKYITVTDVGLVKLSVLFATIAIVKLFPQLLGLGYPVLIALVIICGAKPLYDFWFKR